IGMCFLFILLLDTSREREIQIKSLPLITIILSALSLLGVYFGLAVFSYRLPANTFAQKLYPYYTDNNIELLKQCGDTTQMDAIADSILNQNKYVAVCYSAKAKVAYSKGNFKDLMNYKHIVFDYAPFSYNDYEDYCYMLVNSIALYSRDGDEYSANYCKQELIYTYARLGQLNQKLSYLGKLIKDQPKTELPKDLQQYIITVSEVK
ncbi:MAG: hypothetical protein KBS41_00865, partial [Oscillospiraceae bacterium]|nr:hypothetical protein [Candidatus Equicaccousia limihippi]